jgi:hypothetical protein
MHTNPIPVPPEEYRTLPLAANGAVEAAAEIHPHQRAQSEAEKPCQHCGGSGILRKNSESYRTCLTCLGQGTLPSTNGLVFPLIRPVSSPAASR